MNILIIAYYSPPDNNGGVKRPMAFKKGLQEKGHTVYVLTHGGSGFEVDGSYIRVRDTHDDTSLPGMLINAAYKIKRHVALHLRRCDTYYNAWLHRVRKHSAQVISICKPDLVIASYPPVECLEAGMHFAGKYGIKLITD
ncbi:MAG: hypothetical protein PHN75_20725, partial [Syntrophales bacterium]|nr:hypothetical protein [Syntrophales bacterium]